MTAARARLARFLGRTAAMARKETWHIVRDARNLYLALGLPVVLIVIFGYGVSFDLEDVPVAIVDMDRSAASRSVARSLTGTGELLAVAAPKDPDGADSLFRSREARAVLILPDGMGRDLARGEAAVVQVLVDGSDGVSASSVLGTTMALLRAKSAQVAAQAAGGGGFEPPVEGRVRLLYNPALRSAVFLVPGLIAFVLVIAAVLLTALTVAREWERGNMELLFATPIGRFEIILGKLLPYVAVGLLQALLVLTVGTVWFDVPVRGSFLVLALGTLLFLLTALGQGLLISVVARNQQVATQLGAVTSILPGVLLSGFIIPIENMPVVLQGLASIFPGRYYVAFLRGVLLTDAPASVLLPQMGAMALYAAVVLGLSALRFGRRIG